MSVAYICSTIAGMDVRDRPEPGDHLAQQHHAQVRRVLLDPQVDLRAQLVTGGSQAHRAVPVHGAVSST